MSDKYEIDIQAFAKALQSGQDLNGKDGLLTPLIRENASGKMHQGKRVKIRGMPGVAN
ncbi:hypothetical protein [Salinivibrio sharmensis]|uniref:hypothetical protein n=1 Tax=Salinivibrio sharmensis TaxID=390883 RepID=UPI0013010227|nr:hypothetical protein [Salinivibrio sharmensis]